MIWAILALLGVPLWLCAVGIMALVFRNRSLRKRHGDIPVRVLRPGRKHWTRAHAVWVSDVVAWRGSPAAWREDLIRISAAEFRGMTPEEQKRLRHLDGAVVASFRTDGAVIDVATTAEHRSALLGPFAAAPART